MCYFPIQIILVRCKLCLLYTSKSKYPLDFTLYANNGDDWEPLYFELPTDDLLKFQLRHVCGGLHVELKDKMCIRDRYKLSNTFLFFYVINKA